MKKTFITLLLLLTGVGLAETTVGYTDTYSEWTGKAITLNQSLDLSLEYWSIEATVTVNCGEGTGWGNRIFYSSSAEAPGVNNFFIWHGASAVDQARTKMNFRGFGFNNAQYDHHVTDSSTGEAIVFETGTYMFNYTRDGDVLTLSVYSVKDEEATLLGATVISTPEGMNGTISTLYSDIDTTTMSGYTMPIVRISTVDPTPTPNAPEPATATLSLLALAGLCSRRRRNG